MKIRHDSPVVEGPLIIFLIHLDRSNYPDKPLPVRPYKIFLSAKIGPVFGKAVQLPPFDVWPMLMLHQMADRRPTTPAKRATSAEVDQMMGARGTPALTGLLILWKM